MLSFPIPNTILSPFQITITIANDSYTFQVVHVPVNRVLEHFKVIRGTQEWIFQSNRPLLLAMGLKHKGPKIKWLSGASWNRAWRDRVAEAFAQRLQ